jgi:hypothetical protein
MDRSLLEEGQFFRNKIIEGLDSQAPGGKTLRPLSPFTLKVRRAWGFRGTKALIRSGELRNSVTMVRAGKHAVFVGILNTARGGAVQDRNLAEVGRLHEFGGTFHGLAPSASGKGLHITTIRTPARPFIKPVFDKYGGLRGALRMQARVARKMGGLIGVILNHPDLKGRDPATVPFRFFGGGKAGTAGKGLAMMSKGGARAARQAKAGFRGAQKRSHKGASNSPVRQARQNVRNQRPASPARAPRGRVASPGRARAAGTRKGARSFARTKSPVRAVAKSMNKRAGGGGLLKGIRSAAKKYSKGQAVKARATKKWVRSAARIQKVQVRAAKKAHRAEVSTSQKQMRAAVRMHNKSARQVTRARASRIKTTARTDAKQARSAQRQQAKSARATARADKRQAKHAARVAHRTARARTKATKAAAAATHKQHKARVREHKAAKRSEKRALRAQVHALRPVHKAAKATERANKKQAKHHASHAKKTARVQARATKASFAKHKPGKVMSHLKAKGGALHSLGKAGGKGTRRAKSPNKAPVRSIKLRVRGGAKYHKPS